MAKGNDGNLLQHWVEADLAARLHGMAKDASFHVALTHGMAPFDSFEPRKFGTSGFGRLDAVLATARSARLPEGVPAVASAYRACDAYDAHPRR